VSVLLSVQNVVDNVLFAHPGEPVKLNFYLNADGYFGTCNAQQGGNGNWHELSGSKQKM
jgi:hypothetical protein